ncbi:MAG TPA: hypothetical protein VFA43_19270 [Gemmatimonadaceae bacterium]|nr:hypothetical protein [Gemmatimonadaceae bacterium]
MTLHMLVGVDPGKLNDPTAVVIGRYDDGLTPISERDPYHTPIVYVDHARQPLKTADIAPSPAPRRLDIIHVERRPIDEPYTAMVKYVANLLRLPALTVDGLPPLAIFDCTGVGEPVIDIAHSLGIRPQLISITAGARAHMEAGRWHVPKADLITAIVVALQEGQLKIAAPPRAASDTGPDYVSALVNELTGFRVTTTPSGRDTYAAGEDSRETMHDDLVMALALVAWWAARRVDPDPLPSEYPRFQR